MEDLTDIKNIWQTARLDALPGAEEALKLIKRYRFKMIVKKAASVLLLILMLVLMIYVVFYGPKMLSTRIGEAGFFTGIFVLLISNSNSLRRAFSQTNRTNQEFIEYLKQAQRGRIFFYEQVQPAVFVIISVSLFLYVYELVYKNAGLMLAAYSFLVIYVAVMWFVIRRRIIEKRARQLRETIEKLESFTK